MASPLNPIEGVLAVLDSGSAAGTNKFGLLLALLDLAPSAPEAGFIGDRDLAAKLIELHWEHVRPYRKNVLRQTTSQNKENIVVIAVVDTLQAHLVASKKPVGPFEHVRPMINAVAWDDAIRRVVAATRANPLKRLQVLDRQHVPFLYEVEKGGLRLRREAQQALVRFGPVLRDLVQFRFARFVALANRKELGVSVEDDLAEHLFGFERHMPPVALRVGLWEAQAGRCLYTGSELPKPTVGRATSLDHVVPWARVRVSVVENFVLTTAPANSAKSSLLLAPSLIRRWVDYVGDHGHALRGLAGTFGWPADIGRVAAVAAALYERAGDGTATWAGPGKVVLLDDEQRAEVTAALAALAEAGP